MNVRTAIEKVPLFLGALCVVVAWVFPLATGPSRDAMQQIFVLGSLSTASLMFGVSRITPMAMAALAMALLMLAVSPGVYLGGQIAGFAGVLLAGIACHVGAHMQRKMAALPWLLFAIVAAALINAGEGLLQWFGLVSDLRPWVVEPEQRGIAYGAFRQRNLFATFLCVGSVCTIWLVHARRLTEAMAWFFLLILVFAVAASGSRTGWIELMALAFAGLGWMRQQKASVTRLMIGPLFLYGLATVLLPIAARWHGFGFVTGIERVAEAGQDSRVDLWATALELIRARPWGGWGWLETGYGHYITLFDHRFDGLMSHVHNLPLQIAVEFGLPITIILCSLTLWAVYAGQPWRVGKEVQSHANEFGSGRQFAWLILLFIIGIHSMLELPLWSFGFLFLSGLAAGYLLATPLGSAQSTENTGQPRLAYLGAALLIALATIAWHQYNMLLSIQKAPFNDRDAQREAVVSAGAAWMFRPYLDFAALGLTDLTLQNAADVKYQAENLLHFSAEPRVIQPLLQSLWLLNDLDAFDFHAVRFCRAFPSAFLNWSRENPEQSKRIEKMLHTRQCRLKPDTSD